VEFTYPEGLFQPGEVNALLLQADSGTEGASGECLVEVLLGRSKQIPSWRSSTQRMVASRFVQEEARSRALTGCRSTQPLTQMTTGSPATSASRNSARPSGPAKLQVIE